MLSLVNGILDVEELEEGLLRAAPAPVSMAELTRRIAKSNLVPMRQRELRFEVRMPDDLVAAVDVELFHRMIENLLDNAVRYAPRRGQVVAAASLADGWLRFSIGNDGPPPPVEDRVRLFTRYYRIEERRAGARANRGLGLYFCKLAAEAHGGTITVEDGDPGTLFVVRIPQP
jgi:two-component system heavy metal sensor histidine kinase CusS